MSEIITKDRLTKYFRDIADKIESGEISPISLCYDDSYTSDVKALSFKYYLDITKVKL